MNQKNHTESNMYMMNNVITISKDNQILLTQTGEQIFNHDCDIVHFFCRNEEIVGIIDELNRFVLYIKQMHTATYDKIIVFEEMNDFHIIERSYTTSLLYICCCDSEIFMHFTTSFLYMDTINGTKQPYIRNHKRIVHRKYNMDKKILNLMFDGIVLHYNKHRINVMTDNIAYFALIDNDMTFNILGKTKNLCEITENGLVHFNRGILYKLAYDEQMKLANLMSFNLMQGVTSYEEFDVDIECDENINYFLVLERPSHNVIIIITNRSSYIYNGHSNKHIPVEPIIIFADDYQLNCYYFENDILYKKIFRSEGVLSENTNIVVDQIKIRNIGKKKIKSAKIE